MKANWGSGPDIREGWWCSDVDLYEGLDHQGDILEGLPLDDGSVEIVVANHSLQMIEWSDVRSVLAELVRVLQPGGVLRVLVPDLFTAAGARAAWLANDRAWFSIVDEAEKTTGGKLAAYSAWYSTARTQFTPAWLCELVEEAGCNAALTVVGVSMFRGNSTELDTRAHESIVVEGQKR